MTTHYVFDHSQMFLDPHFSQQVGPLIFHHPKKNGTRCHDQNSIISLIHRYLQEKSLMEKYSVFHADNHSWSKQKTRPCFIICHDAVSKD